MFNVEASVLCVITIGLIAEFSVLTIRKMWRIRQLFVLVACIGVVASMLITTSWLLLNTFLVLIVLTRLFNLARLAKGRMHYKYARHAGLRTTMILLVLQIVTVGLGTVYTNIVETYHSAFGLLQIVFASSLLLFTIIMAYSVARTIIKTRHLTNTHFYSDSELPTVSVLVPARNETSDLQDCLRSLLANDYPKLEVIVYDDCSHVETSDIIKSFAQKGVRFIKGVEPDKHWLAKNRAYQALLEEATGEYVIFCGVDARFSSGAIRALVTTMLNRNKAMISILPMRHYGTPESAVIQPMRYWWQLVPPRRLFNRPPVLSTCWAVRRKNLLALGGFAALSRAIVPEMYLAREFARHNDSYGFIRADKELDIQTVKSLPEQRDTAIRTRYPLVKRRPENVLLLIVVELLFFVGLPAFALYGLATNNLLLAVLGVLGVLVTVFIQYSVVRVSSPAHTPYAVIILPIVVAAEIATLLISMYKYEFSKVIWKERNVCLPVMHAIPRLPKI